MKKLFTSEFTRLALIAVTATMFAGCATTPSGEAESAPQAQAAAAIEPWEGDPMDMPLDGSSMDAFEASLARFQAHASPEQYSGLLSALDYLETYDIAAEGDREKLVKRLDGSTPNEIFKRVKWRTPAPGRSPAEKDAADAKILDA